MSIPVVICDDSSFARKQVARALPPGWDVDVTFAANGREALQAVRAGRGDILFLDLTMPEMDGFQVLEAIRRDDLPTMTIVISGDIQAESRRRVQELGAVAFVKKPVDGEALAAVLKDYGVLSVLTAQGGGGFADEPVAVTDWVQELSNVSMGRAADLLTSLIQEPIELSVPRVCTLEPAELDMALVASSGNGFSMVAQGFIGGGVSGEVLLLFADRDVPELARLLHFGGDLDRAGEVELLTDLGNVLVGAYLKGIADQLDIGFSLGQPRIHLPDSPGAKPLRYMAEHPRRVLSTELTYTIGGAGLHCDQLVLLTEASLAALEQSARYVL